MTTMQPSGENDARSDLLHAHDLALRVRRSQRATWFPLLVFAILSFAAIPVVNSGHPSGVVCRSGPNGTRACIAHNSAAFIYWPIALVLAYVVIAAFYMRQSRARGVGNRVTPYVVVGVVIAIALTLASYWAAERPRFGQYNFLGWHLVGPDFYRALAPGVAIGLGLLVLAYVERNLALVGVTIVFLVIAIGGVNLGWTIMSPARWSFMPHLVIEGGILLISAIGFFLAQRDSTA